MFPTKPDALYPFASSSSKDSIVLSCLQSWREPSEDNDKDIYSVPAQAEVSPTLTHSGHESTFTVRLLAAAGYRNFHPVNESPSLILVPRIILDSIDSRVSKYIAVM